MKQKPLISIIIPTFNSQDTLLTCLESVVKQTFKDFEVLILDNISKDNTLSIAKSFNDYRIKIFSEADKGVYFAMNKGIDLAKGDWIFFLGSDDNFYKPNTLEKIVSSKDFIKYDVVYGNVSSSHFKGIYGGKFDYYKLEKQNICHQAIFFNKKVFNIVGKFNLKYLIYADWEHNIRWFFSDKIKVNYLNEIITSYGPNGLSSLNRDAVFDRNKSLILFYYGFKIFNFIKLIKLLFQPISFYFIKVSFIKNKYKAIKKCFFL